MNTNKNFFSVSVDLTVYSKKWEIKKNKYSTISNMKWCGIRDVAYVRTD